MININDFTVAVETSAELKSILEGTNSITHIYLANEPFIERWTIIKRNLSFVIFLILIKVSRVGDIHNF